MLLAFLVTWAHCWLTFSRTSASTPRSFSTAQLAKQFDLQKKTNPPCVNQTGLCITMDQMQPHGPATISLSTVLGSPFPWSMGSSTPHIHGLARNPALSLLRRRQRKGKEGWNLLQEPYAHLLHTIPQNSPRILAPARQHQQQAR